MAKLTKTMIDRLPIKGERYEVADDALAGFYIRVNGGGSKTAIVRYFKDGRAGSYTLGKLGEHFPFAEARAQARKILGDVARGQDPARDRKRRRDAPTVAALAERFMSDHAAPYCKPRTVAMYETIVRLHVLPELGSMKVQEIERCDVERLHQRVGKDAPYMANRVVAVLSCMMSKAEAWGYRRPQSNPCYRVPKFRERKVERFLSGEERAQLAIALDRAERAPWGNNDYVAPGAVTAIRLLELTGARCGEIVGLEWSMVDLERSCLRLPDSKTGAKVIPLSPQAVAFLRELERKASKGAEGGKPRGWVCVGDRGGPVHNIERAWRSIRKRAGLEDVRLHDLRHSAASDMAAAGLSLPIIGRVLGNKSTQTTARYAHLAEQHGHDAARVMGEQMERNTREGAERLRQREEEEKARAKLAAGAEHGEGEAREGGAVIAMGGGNVIRFPGKRRG
jgi:integrase